MNNSIGARISLALESSGLSRKELSRITGLTETAICRYINDEREPRVYALSLIADALNVSLDSLTGKETINNNDLNNSVQLIARNANKLSNEEKRVLVDALLELAE